jgi:hypothetical protein
MFGRRIRGAVEGVAAHANSTLDKTDQLIALLSTLITLVKGLAVAVTDDVRELLKEAGDEVNVTATARVPEGFDLRDFLSGKSRELPLEFSFRIVVKE